MRTIPIVMLLFLIFLLTQTIKVELQIDNQLLSRTILVIFFFLGGGGGGFDKIVYNDYNPDSILGIDFRRYRLTLTF